MEQDLNKNIYLTLNIQAFVKNELFLFIFACKEY